MMESVASALNGWRRWRAQLRDSTAGVIITRIRRMTVDAASERDGQAGLPTYFTRFVGRDRELRALRAWALEAAGSEPPTRRITTLVGLGGSGKTRLAVEVATSLREHPDCTAFPDGTWWVDLAPVTDPQRVPLALAEAAGLPPPRLGDQHAALRRALVRRHALVVLDNCEHLATACEELFAGVVAGCPGLVVFATSRIPLVGGREFAMPAMQSRADNPSSRTEAVTLFYDRAGLLLPGYATLASDEAMVAAICERVGGLPLAIELAAPWVRILSATDVLAQLDRSQEVLSASAGGESDRHHSMRAVLDSTWAWLSAEQQSVLRGLGTFVGGFGRDGAEAVTGATLATLSVLTERSLIRRVPATDDDTRYVMHEVVRQYAVDRLDELPASEADGLRHRHLEHLVELSGRFMVSRNGPEESRWLARLREEQANVELATARGIERGSELVLRLVGDMLDVWIYSGSVSRHRQAIESALGLPWDQSSDTAADARARVAYAAGWTNFELGGEGRGREHFLEALALYRRLENTGEHAACLRALSRIASETGDHVGAERLARQSLSLCRRSGDQVGVGWSLSHLFGEAWATARLEEAELLLLDSIASFRRAGVAFGEEGSLVDLGTLRRRRRQWPQALAAYADSVAIMRASGFTAEGRDLLLGLAAVAAELGAPIRAARLFAAAETWEQAHGASSRYNTAVMERTDRQREAARAVLGADGWIRESARGAQLSSDQALKEAVDTIAELEAALKAPLPAGLTPREVEVLTLLSEGLSNDELAARLVVSPRTVHAHLRAIFGKLGVSSRIAAVHEAVRLGVRL